MDVTQFKSLIFVHTKISDAVNTFLNQQGAKYDLTAVQLRILMHLYKTGATTIGNLAENIGMAGANISTMCKRLEKKGVMSRKRDVNDERIVRISLTDKGNSIVKEIDHSLNERFSKVIEKESEETFIVIIKGLKMLNELLEKIESTNFTIKTEETE